MLPQRRLSYARGYLELGLVAEAAMELDRLPPAEAGSLPAVAVRIAVLHQQEDWPALRTVAARLVEQGTTDAPIWVTWAYATRRADSLAAAEAILLRAERLHPDDPTIQFNLGCYASLQGDLATARRRINRAIELDGKFHQLAATDPDLAGLRAAGGPPDGRHGA